MLGILIASPDVPSDAEATGVGPSLSVLEFVAKGALCKGVG